MTSRERVKKVIHHEIPDRVPIDVGGTKVTGINAFEYIRIANHIGIDVLPPKVYEQFQMLARVEMPVMKWFHSDVIQVENASESWGYKNEKWKVWTPHKAFEDLLVPRTFNPEKDENGDYILRNDDGKAFAKMPKNGHYFDRIESFSTSFDIVKTDLNEFKKTMTYYSKEELKAIRNNARFLHENTDYSVHGGFLKGKLGSSSIFAGHTFTEWMIVLLTEPEYAYELLNISSDATVKNLEMYLEAVDGYIDTILLSTTDFGSQKSEMFNPNIFKEVYMPNYKKMCTYVHQNCNVKTMLHSCGSIRNIIPHFVEAGVDILNPIQANTENMDPMELKEAFGKQLVFWGGGVNTQDVLPYGTQDEVEAQVKERIEQLGQNGGFVFSAIHNIQDGIPMENLERMVQAVLKYGKY